MKFTNDIKLAIIGGSGLYDVEEFKDREVIKIDTPWGKPSDDILKTKEGGITKVDYYTNLDRKNVYISNIINYRPPENRRPTDEEMNRYLPFIKRHIEIIDPKILVLLGSTAMNAIVGNDVVISKVRGQWIEKEFGLCKTSIIVTFHPAFLMRQPTQKKLAWIDLKMIRDKKAKFKI